MTFELYSLINRLMLVVMAMGLVLPAVVIYYYSAYKNYWALILSAAAVIAISLPAGEYAIIFLPLILPIIFSGIVGSLLRKSGENFLTSMGYMIMAQMGGAIVGIIVIYFYFGMQDIAGLIAEGFRSAYSEIPAGDEMRAFSLDVMTWALMVASKGMQVPFGEVTALDVTEKLNYIVPLLRQGVVQSLPAVVLDYGIIGGVWAWFLSSVMINKRAANKRELKGVKEYVPSPPFSEWKLPRWITNVLMVILLAAVILSFSSEATLLNVASVLQSVAIVIIGIQGLSVLNWWLKKKKLPTGLNVLICVMAVVLLNFILPWLGVFDIVFSIRLSKEKKEEIRAQMEKIKKQVDEQIEMMEKEKKNEEENKEIEKKEEKQEKENKKDDNDENEQDESEGNK